ncbi:hypothetical protein [Rhizobium sp. BR 315]|uniref:hypothetical protein n=1 Tax=Rhizobium sp. BR 315 TaxID=3040014 RepID=UPI003D333397
MTNNNRSDDSWIFLVAAGIVGSIAFVVWKFSVLFGLDVSTGAAVFFRLVLLGIAFGGAWWLGNTYDEINIGGLWPIVFALVWACWWPALNFWASAGVAMPATHLFDFDQSTSMPALGTETLWWAAWYTKWGVFVAIIGIGYWVKDALQKN